MVNVARLTNRPVRSTLKTVSYDLVLPDTLMGVEVEVDSDYTTTSTHPETMLRHWNKHHDGSLNNGYEYTLNRPMSGTELSTAIAELFAPPSDFHRTFTGSTHIHIDMLEEAVTLDALRTMVLMVYMLEPVLYAAGDRSREWCGYANSLKTAEPMLLSTLFSDDVEDQFSRTYRRGGQLGRYYGLNLAALTDYGSLEFRYFPTASTAEELVSWINLVQSFKKAALEIGSPEALKEIINDEQRYIEMVEKFFPKYVALFNDVIQWRTVHSMFTKAGIVINDAKLVTPAMFNGRGVFKQARFNSLVSVTDPRDLSDTAMAPFVNNGNVPSGPANGTVLFYNGRLYVRMNEWHTLYDNSRRVALAPETLATLQFVQDTMGQELTVADRHSIDMILLRGELVGNYYEEVNYEEEDDEEDLF